MGVTISICDIWAIKEILNNKVEDRELIRKIMYYIVAVMSTALSYWGVFKVLEKVGYLAPTGTIGMDNMFGNMLSQLLGMIRVAYQVLFDYFFTDTIVKNSWRLRKYLT